MSNASFPNPKRHFHPVEPITLLKSVVGMSFVAIVVAGTLVPDLARSGLTWGQGLIAMAGGIVGALLSLTR